jgi:predicted nucleic acid-binding protein
MAWCFEDEDDAYAERVFDHLGQATALVPSFWKLEVANVMLVALKHSRISQGQADGFLARLAQLPIEIVDDEISTSAAFELGRRYGLTSYDAAYLHVAMTEGVPLATSDAALRRAARKARAGILTL